MIVNNYYCDKDHAGRPCCSEQLGLILEKLETLLMSFEDLKAAQAETVALIGNVKADVEALMAKLADFVASGMTGDQVAEAVAATKAINEQLGGVDALNP